MQQRDDVAGRGPEPILLFLRMAPVWVFVDEVRHFVESFCACAGVGPERESQLALATHELLQNAITNSTSTSIELRLAIDRTRDTVEVSLTNACSPAASKVLCSRLAALRETDPMTSYLRAMSLDPAGPGGLGLARVRYEAQLELELETDGDRSTVRAFGKVNPPPLSGAKGVLHG